jgi:NADH dehydrogenase/NADH:ubiquinone oxidoreductase subunit G
MALPLAVVPAGLAVGLSKRAENRRRQAAANEYSKKYPLLDNASAMQQSIDAALIELKTIDATPANTAGAKRVKKRNSATLRSWMLTMKEHMKDLQSGMAIATTQQSGNIAVMPELKALDVSRLSDTEKTVLPMEQTGTMTSETTNLAENTQKKGVNWLLIGGVAVALIVVYKLVKKN